MKKGILVFALFWVLALSFSLPVPASAGGGAGRSDVEPIAEEILESTEFSTDAGRFREVRNLQNYREFLLGQGLSERETAVRMLEASGYTAEQIDRMPDEAVLQALRARESVFQTVSVFDGSERADGLNLVIGYRTMKISKYVSGRDPDDFVLISVFFDWAGAPDGLPEEHGEQRIRVGDDSGQKRPGLSFELVRKPPYPSFEEMESFSGSCLRRSGCSWAEQELEGREPDLIYSGDLSGYFDYLDEMFAEQDRARTVAFELPGGLFVRCQDLKGYYQVIAEVDHGVEGGKRFQVRCGRAELELDVRLPAEETEGSQLDPEG